jgi:hypothetical protein
MCLEHYALELAKRDNELVNLLETQKEPEATIEYERRELAHRDSTRGKGRRRIAHPQSVELVDFIQVNGTLIVLGFAYDICNVNAQNTQVPAQATPLDFLDLSCDWVVLDFSLFQQAQNDHVQMRSVQRLLQTLGTCHQELTSGVKEHR